MGHASYALEPEAIREDYFIRLDTVIIGCTSGAAAGMLAGSIPLTRALSSGIGISESFLLASYLTGLGCGVGAASSVVAILTAWLLPSVVAKSTQNRKPSFDGFE